MSDFSIRVGNNIRRFREANDMTIVQLAKKIGMSQPNLSKIERGEPKKVDYILLDKIANALEVSREDLTEWKNKENQQAKHEEHLRKRADKNFALFYDLSYSQQKEIVKYMTKAKRDSMLFDELCAISDAYINSSNEIRGAVCRTLDVHSAYRKRGDTPNGITEQSEVV